jgi:hypothetical protein
MFLVVLYVSCFKTTNSKHNLNFLTFTTCSECQHWHTQNFHTLGIFCCHLLPTASVLVDHAVLSVYNSNYNILDYPTSTRRHGNFAGVHTLLRILLPSNSAVLINIITGVLPPHFDIVVYYVLCQC